MRENQAEAKMADLQTEDSVTPRQSDLDAELALSAAASAAANALRAGARAPLFTLTDTIGQRVSLEALLRAGPAVLHFFRGGWCTFGERSLADLATGYDDMLALGASAVAIAPPCERPAHHAAGGLRELLDVDLKLARAYGVAFELPVRLRASYEQLGCATPSASEASRWLVPIPATFLIDRDGRIALAHVDVDYRKRLDIESLLRALKALHARHATKLHALRERLGRSL
ncbi:peroxiredoxin-like family protein [Paraburkholderia dipogonis]|uniref:peroxiredoxin-like family protein n=1 Tax=Paraburkholderia dipogonis TaxID=1211383 RepID=UPI0038B71505